MMRHKTAVLLLIVFLGASSLVAANVQSPAAGALPEPVVTKAVAPLEYPAIARQAHADGKVVVKVEIDAHGDVVSALVVEGHPLLKSAAVKAARRWQFAAVAGADKRTAQLIFDFHIPAKKEEEETSFKPPYEIYFATGARELMY